MARDVVYRLESVRQEYDGRVVLDIDRLDIARGETLAVIGPSGSGKSTLLRLLQFLEAPSEGRVSFEGREMNGRVALATRRRVSTVFQRPIALTRSVEANVAYGIELRGRRPDAGEIRGLLEALDLAPLARRPAASLSGGEIQRLAVARALATRPDVLLLDEPTANLDPRNVRLVETLVQERRALGMTIVLATHQIFQARRLADRIALLLDGRIAEAGPAQALLDRPADARTRAFLSGEMIY
ncbi:MAG TPA: ATP-binding cassette domain-containing protein [Vicinamibacterales bacterium]|nr:ATP-binding cassette domain-containing protein [Acidobacteriota bacterium]HOC17272.1 ATP-binding cassette domain-containing protein [Vicinamibacterales bacterium]